MPGPLDQMYDDQPLKPLDQMYYPLGPDGWPIVNINRHTQMDRQYPVWTGPPPSRFDRPVSPWTHPFLTPEYGWQNRPENPALSDAPPEIPAPWARFPYRDRSRYVPGRDPVQPLPYQALRQPAGDPVNDPEALRQLLQAQNQTERAITMRPDALGWLQRLLGVR